MLARDADRVFDRFRAAMGESTRRSFNESDSPPTADQWALKGAMARLKEIHEEAQVIYQVVSGTAIRKGIVRQRESPQAPPNNVAGSSEAHERRHEEVLGSPQSRGQSQT